MNYIMKAFYEKKAFLKLPLIIKMKEDKIITESRRNEPQGKYFCGSII